MKILLKVVLLDLVTRSTFIVLYFVRTTCGQCEPEWTAVKASGTCVRYIDAPAMSWNDARAYCKLQSGDLIEIHNRETNAAIWGLIKDLGSSRVWIGLRKQGNSFLWNDDLRKIKYSNWGLNQPNIQGENACGSLRYFADGTWSDDNCLDTQPFVCEKFADCSFESQGYVCEKICSKYCYPRPGLPTCDVRNGHCFLAGCYKGYRGDMCDKACNNGTYGYNCTFTCNATCGGPDNACENEDGYCKSGCDIGYTGPLCGSLCESGTYGLGCTQLCSPYCGGEDKACKATDGTCLHGCASNFTGSKCTVCEAGRYGLGCTQLCSAYCGGADKACNETDGTCLHGCVDSFTGSKCIDLVEKVDDEGGSGVFIILIVSANILLILSLLLFGLKKSKATAAAGEEVVNLMKSKTPSKGQSKTEDDRGLSTTAPISGSEQQSSQGSKEKSRSSVSGETTTVAD